WPRRTHQSPSGLLHRLRNSLRSVLPGPAPGPRLLRPESITRRGDRSASHTDSVGRRSSVGRRFHSLLSRFKDLAGAQGSVGGQSAQHELMVLTLAVMRAQLNAKDAEDFAEVAKAFPPRSLRDPLRTQR